ncbi:type IV pilus modification PilV family protein [Desulfatibacillum aliphaticivorans]|uniref:type IV pilus modification PilV family protein n=1 Tax=Desulfatibacillum aliphaticivorans TaxID=218208 RepID=UPI00016023C4|nr:hypothetical protein [Desulfatibacillum aliphaticivorans]
MTKNNWICKIRDRLKDQQGAYLIEVLIAMCILSVGVLAAGSMQANSISTNTFISIQGEAMALARSTLEIVVGAEFDSLDTLPPSRTVLTQNGREMTINIDVEHFTADLTNVKVSVVYDNRGTTRTMTLETTRSSAEKRSG